MKDLSKLLVIRELLKSLQLIKKNIFWLVMASLVDALFFVAWGLFTTPVKEKIVQHAILLTNQLSPLLAEKQQGILNLMFTPEMQPMTGKLILLMLTLFAVTYIVYTAFHGTSWWMATQIAEKKLNYRQYMLGFARVNLIWITGYLIYKFLDVLFSVRYAIIKQLIPGTPYIAGKVLFVYLLFLGIAAFLSYPLLKATTIFKTPIKVTGPLVILSASMYLATQFILNNIGKASVDVALIVGLVLLFPVMNLIRTYAIRVLSNVHTRT